MSAPCQVTVSAKETGGASMVQEGPPPFSEPNVGHLLPFPFCPPIGGHLSSTGVLPEKRREILVLFK